MLVPKLMRVLCTKLNIHLWHTSDTHEWHTHICTHTSAIHRWANNYQKTKQTTFDLQPTPKNKNKAKCDTRLCIFVCWERFAWFLSFIFIWFAPRTSHFVAQHRKIVHRSNQTNWKQYIMQSNWKVFGFSSHRNIFTLKSFYVCIDLC